MASLRTAILRGARCMSRTASRVAVHGARNTTRSLAFCGGKPPLFLSLLPARSYSSSGSDSDFEQGLVRVQCPAPDFKGTAVVDGQFKEIELENFKGKYLVLFFYPLDFTFVCPTELISFSDNMDKFNEINTAVVGVSTDSHFSHLAWLGMPRKQGGLGGLKYPLLSDFNKTISRDYGVLVEEEGLALRGLFIIDPSGIVRQITINDLPVGRSVDEVLRLVKAFQFVDQYGEVCPANWNPDSNPDTIKPNPQDSKEYFEKAK